MTNSEQRTYGAAQGVADRRTLDSTERTLVTVGGGALIVYGLTRRDLGGAVLAALGGALLYQGIEGHDRLAPLLGLKTAEQGGVAGIKIEKRLTIEKPADELYRFWRNFENLPQFMKHLESVRVSGDRHSHWVAKAPADTSVEWDAEIIDEREGEYIAWRSAEGSMVMNAGEVRFVAAPAGRGTEVHISMVYDPPAGSVGVVIAKLFGEEPSQQIDGDLRRFKSLMEAGEIPTVEGQSSGRRSEVEKQRQDMHKRADKQQLPTKANQLGARSAIGKALEDTFPASDPPATTQTPEDGEGVTNADREVGLGKRIY